MLIGILLFYNFVSAQVPNVKKTAYFILCQTSLSNGRPVNTLLISDTLSFIKKLDTIKDEDSFMCELFKNTILCKDPALGMFENSELHKFENDRKKKRFLRRLNSLIITLNNRLDKVTLTYRVNEKKIDLKVAKIDAGFWEIRTDVLNFYSGSYPVRKECYLKDYIYNVSDILKIYKLDGQILNP